MPDLRGWMCSADDAQGWLAQDVPGGPDSWSTHKPLQRAHPDPFNSATMILVSLPADAPHVELVVYDLLGQRVRRLAEGPLSPGVHAVQWDGREDRGAELSSGVYVYRLRVGSVGARGRAVLVK